MSQVCVTPGPLRAASTPGTSITAYVFRGISSALSLIGKSSSVDISARRILGGYTFAIYCHLARDRSGEVSVRFDFELTDGKWNDHLEWPFSKKVTVIITHPRDEGKDVRVPINVNTDAQKQKPAQDSTNDLCSSDWVSWKLLELNGFIDRDSLYVNLEFS